MATHSSVLAWRISWTEEPGWQATVHRVTKSQTPLKQLSTHINSGKLRVRWVVYTFKKILNDFGRWSQENILKTEVLCRKHTS